MSPLVVKVKAYSKDGKTLESQEILKKSQTCIKGKVKIRSRPIP